MFVGKARNLPFSGATERCSIQVGSGLTHKHLTRLQRPPRNKYLVNYGFYLTFYSRNLRMFVLIFAPDRPSQLVFCLFVRLEPTWVEPLWGALLLSRPCPQTSDKASKACQGQTLLLITNIRILRPKKFISIGPSSNCYQTYFSSTTKRPN
jgi:hypothetical protein